MKKFLALLLTLVMATALLAGCGSSSSDSSTADTSSSDSSTSDSSSDSTTTFEPMTWKFACSATDTSNWVSAAKEFARIVSEKTDGAITVEYYPSDQLTAGSQTEGIQALMDGTTDMSMHSNLIYSSFNPKFNVVSLPFLFDSVEEVDAAMDGEGGQALQSILEDEMGLHLLGVGENGFRHPTNSKREINSMADMKGLKLRIAGSALLNRMYELWGVNYVNANWSEVFTGMQTGTYDGQENPLPTADAASVYEVQKYVTYWTGAYDCLFFCMNGELYDSLSPELQAIVDEAGQAAVEYQRDLNRGEDETILAKWEDAGLTVSRLSDEAVAEFKEAAASCYDEFADELTPELIAAFTGE